MHYKWAMFAPTCFPFILVSPKESCPQRWECKYGIRTPSSTPLIQYQAFFMMITCSHQSRAFPLFCLNCFQNKHLKTQDGGQRKIISQGKTLESSQLPSVRSRGKCQVANSFPKKLHDTVKLLTFNSTEWKLVFQNIKFHIWQINHTVTFPMETEKHIHILYRELTIIYTFPCKRSSTDLRNLIC